jgi:SNF2 family DNA or RNA helicase
LTQKKREECLNSFKNDPKQGVLLGSLKATAVGLNLTEASEVIFIDMWWNPAVEDQAIARVHRIGQTRDVNIIRFCIKNTVEERIVGLQEKKVVWY